MYRETKRIQNTPKTARKLLGISAAALIAAGYLLRASALLPTEPENTAIPPVPTYARTVLRAEPSVPPPIPSPEPEPPTPEPTAAPSPAPIDLDPAVHTVTVMPSDSLEHAAGVYLKNETSFEIDVLSYLEAELPEEVRTAPQHVIIVHTHASEAYYPQGENEYIPTDVQRTEDDRYNVIRVGDLIAEQLKTCGIAVTHIREIFDYPSYAGSYTRALESLEEAIGSDPETNIVIDIHRDAITSSDGSAYRLVSDTDEGRAAQMMFVVGTGESGLDHPDWRQNLTFAIHLQKYLVDRYPDLMRPIALSVSRYNQHLTKGSLILEIGAAGNLLEEALLSARLFSETFTDFLADIAF